MSALLEYDCSPLFTGGEFSLIHALYCIVACFLYPHVYQSGHVAVEVDGNSIIKKLNIDTAAAAAAEIGSAATTGAAASAGASLQVLVYIDRVMQCRGMLTVHCCSRCSRSVQSHVDHTDQCAHAQPVSELMISLSLSASHCIFHIA